MPTQDLTSRLAAGTTIDDLPAIVDLATAIPPNPPEELQRNFVGASYADAYEEADAFVTAVDAASRRHAGAPLSAATRVGDFGSGWGRISRLLLDRLPATALYAMDVDPGMTALVNVTLPGLNALTVDPLPKTPLGTNSLDAMLAFSVFSHLSGEAHEAWAAEFGRLVRPGGVVAFTVLEEDFLTTVQGATEAVRAGEGSDFAQSLAGIYPDVDAAIAGYRAGEIQYAGTGGGGVRTGDFYGWAAAPRAYVDRVWSAAGFRLVEWVPSGQLFGQALVVLVRRDLAGAAKHQVGQGLRLARRAVRGVTSR